MSTELQIEYVKEAGASRMFWEMVRLKGGIEPALRTYDSRSVNEAIQMLKGAVKYSVFKLNGEIVVEEK